jgi:hypothetical protein
MDTTVLKTMASITYGGVKYAQVRHAVYCKICKDTIESTLIRDFKQCACGSAAVDGGISCGNRILGDIEKMESRSMYVAQLAGKTVWLGQDIIEAHFRSRH